MYQRSLKPLLTNSFFIFGSRGTGKSTLLKEVFKDLKPLWVDLLDEEVALQYLGHPKLLEEQIRAFSSQPGPRWIVIDEVQRVPALLNYVHRLIETDKKTRFALTGSSARKLKREGANLLAGRAFLNHLHPFTAREMGAAFDLNQTLQWGSLPKLTGLSSDLEKSEYLKSYVQVYLREEIKEEQVVRKITPFIKFLEVSAQTNGQIVNYSKVGRDAASDPKAVERYFEILIDTLIGFFLEPFHRSVRKRQTQKSKFYYFDLGVKRALERALPIPLQPSTYGYGKAFEHFFILECIRLNDYYRTDYRFSYFQTKDALEVDLVVERPGQRLLLIEIKSSRSLHESDLSRYRKIRDDLSPCDFWFATQEETPRRIDGFEILPWHEVLERLFVSK